MWRRLSPIPGGRWAFGWLLGRIVPYSASVNPQVVELEPGHARIALHDRRFVRNHLSSVHAIALANVAELASGLAMTTALPDDVRAIVVRICVDYLKKARGTLIAESHCTLPNVVAETECDFLTDVRDSAGDVVARATVTWRLRPGQPS
jgi:acyl-coenzyme A thioesterase PaaI-like protein